jgi:hypothetical protein
LGSELQSLDSEHCVFGEVSEGNEVLLKLNEVICDSEHRPYQDIRYSNVVIVREKSTRCVRYNILYKKMWTRTNGANISEQLSSEAKYAEF